MRMNPLFRATLIYFIAMTSKVEAGGLAGGGGPPSLKAREIMLQTNSGTAALFVWDENTLGICVDHPLAAEITLTREGRSHVPMALPDGDFRWIASKLYTVKLINRKGEIRTYRVTDGREAETLDLIDRRTQIRPRQ